MVADSAASGLRAAALAVVLALTFATLRTADAQQPDRQSIGTFSIDRTEVTIRAFAAFANATGLVTEAERAGGGFEWAGGWTRRPGWTFRTPYGAPPARDDEPAVHVTWAEASAYCTWAGGRLPSAAEWRQAAYTETRPSPPPSFEAGRTYPYPTGEEPTGMNLRGIGPGRHLPVGETRAGVNGLYDMGGNVWEWASDASGSDRLTMGGSWWYGPAQTQADGAQWKPADFSAVYIGLRCAYPS